jgi:hypothetical protein
MVEEFAVVQFEDIGLPLLAGPNTESMPLPLSVDDKR